MACAAGAATAGAAVPASRTSGVTGSGCCSSSITTPRISTVCPKIIIAANVVCTCGRMIAATDVAAVIR